VVPVNSSSIASPAIPAARPSGWTAGRITALVVGIVVGLISLGLLGGAGTAFWADWTQRDAGYVTTSVHQFSTAGSALATEPVDLGTTGAGWLYGPSLLGDLRIRVTPTDPASTLFVGIGRSADVDRYLAGVNRTVISDFWDSGVQNVPGDRVGSAPGTQSFWAASTSGTGARSLVWEPANGSWSVVVMNADGRPGIDVRADLGAKVSALLWVGIGLLIVGAVFATLGAFLIVGSIRRVRRARTT
jgi:hypothetical protein